MKGSGGLYHRHDHVTCPPEVDGVRPEHRCKGRWAVTVELPKWPDGRRHRKTLYGRSKAEVLGKLAAVREVVR